MPLFSPEMHKVFAANYPERAHRLAHQLGTPDLFSLEGVARLAEALPDPSVHYNFVTCRSASKSCLRGRICRSAR